MPVFIAGNAITVSCPNCCETGTGSAPEPECCPGVVVPSTLYATVESDCGLIDGLVVELTKVGPGELWSGSEAIACADCTVFTVTLQCVEGSYVMGLGFSGETCAITPNVGGTSVFTLIDCDPFVAEFDDNTISQVGNPACCTITFVHIVVTE